MICVKKDIFNLNFEKNKFIVWIFLEKIGFKNNCNIGDIFIKLIFFIWVVRVKSGIELLVLKIMFILYMYIVDVECMIFLL